jgi:hypothetical protein
MRKDLQCGVDLKVAVSIVLKYIAWLALAVRKFGEVG